MMSKKPSTKMSDKDLKKVSGGVTATPTPVSMGNVGGGVLPGGKVINPTSSTPPKPNVVLPTAPPRPPRPTRGSRGG